MQEGGPKGINRRAGFALIAAGLMTGCDAVNSAESSLPVIRVRLDMLLSDLAAQSSYKFPAGFVQGEPGHNFITTPHTFIYEDETLKLHVERAGSLPSMPTNIGYDVRLRQDTPPSMAKDFTVELLPAYSPLQVALIRAREVRDLLLAQGFEIVPWPWKNKFSAVISAAPKPIENFEDLEFAFLDSRFFAQSATFLAFKKEKLSVELRMVNARRKHGTRHDPSIGLDTERAQREAQTMSREDLLREEVYYLTISIGPTPEWSNARSEKLDEATRRIRESAAPNSGTGQVK